MSIISKKYELTSETKKVNICSGTYIVHRIKALKDFGDVKKGDLGGWVEKESNLSQEGNCWIYDNAMVYENAKVQDNAKVFDNVCACDNSLVKDNAEVHGDDVYLNGTAIIHDYAKVLKGEDISVNIGGHAIVDCYGSLMGCGEISGNAQVKGSFTMVGKVKIRGNAILNGDIGANADDCSEGILIEGNTEITGYLDIYICEPNESVIIDGNTKLQGSIDILGTVHISDDVVIDGDFILHDGRVELRGNTVLKNQSNSKLDTKGNKS